MALNIETGNSVEGANSYASIEFADTYHTNLGNADWAGEDSAKELALIVACQSLDLLYGPKYLSYRLDADQALLWPRYPFDDSNGNVRMTNRIPVELKNAQAELALIVLTNSTDVFPEGNPASSVAQESITVGQITTSTTYRAPRQEQATYVGFRKLDLILWPLLKSRQSSVRLHR